MISLVLFHLRFLGLSAYIKVCMQMFKPNIILIELYSTVNRIYYG